MKKIISLGLVLVMVLGLAASGASGKPAETTAVPETETALVVDTCILTFVANDGVMG